MKNRTRVILKNRNVNYKFFSIFFLKDGSFLIHDHLKNEEAPLFIAEPFHLLKNLGRIIIKKFDGKIEEKGDQVHLSIHPKRIYLKKRSAKGQEKHLLEEVEPQPFNDKGYRLHCILTPAPLKFLEACNETIGDIIFDWNSSYCPQVSIYELSNNFDKSLSKELFPEAEDIKILFLNEKYPSIALCIRKTNGEPNIWKSNYAIFGKFLHKGLINKEKLKDIIAYNGLSYDISSMPDTAIVSDFEMNVSKTGEPLLTVIYSCPKKDFNRI